MAKAIKKSSTTRSRKHVNVTNPIYDELQLDYLALDAKHLSRLIGTLSTEFIQNTSLDAKAMAELGTVSSLLWIANDLAAQLSERMNMAVEREDRPVAVQRSADIIPSTRA